jgi:hypothetical protein
MLTNPCDEITQVLVAWSEGNRKAFDELAPLIYAALHRLAQQYVELEFRGGAR